MSDLLLYYQRPEPATWVFHSSFLLLGLYFVFHRFFSIRNLDLILLILLSPGLMMVYEGRRQQAESSVAAQSPIASQNPEDAQLANLDAEREPDTASNLASPLPNADNVASESEPSTTADAAAPMVTAAAGTRMEFYGFVALLIACGLIMLRMLLDPALNRRPLLVPNLSIGGLTFIGVSLFIFLMANVITSSPDEQELRGPRLGPGYALLNMLPNLPTTPDKLERKAQDSSDLTEEQKAASTAQAPWVSNVARILAIVSNLAIVLGIVGVGYWHFDNVQTGIGCAVMYLLLPYTAQMTGNLQHVLPAALLILAMLAYRQPLISGSLLGLAAGLVYYPLFLLPLWISFYWHRGLARLLTGISGSLTLLSGLLLLQGFDAFIVHVRWMFGLWRPRMGGLEGIWGADGIPPDFRLPVLVGFILLSVSFVFWPSRKHLGTLMCCTSAIMLAAQFWHGNGGGLYMSWFLPFTLLTIFRPNLDDRVATTVVKNRRKRPQKFNVEKTTTSAAA